MTQFTRGNVESRRGLDVSVSIGIGMVFWRIPESRRKSKNEKQRSDEKRKERFLWFWVGWLRGKKRNFEWRRFGFGF